jgi:hypothetical protein
MNNSAARKMVEDAGHLFRIVYDVFGKIIGSKTPTQLT